MHKTALLALAVFAFAQGSAQAQILFDNGVGPSLTFLNDYYSDQGTNFTHAGNVFSPTSSGMAEYLTFDGVYVVGPTVLPTDSFTIDLFSVAGDAPGTVTTEAGFTELSRTAVGKNEFGATVYEFSGQLSTPFDLRVGTNYFLAVTNSTPDEFAYVLNTTGTATSIYQFVVSNGAFQPGTGAFSFQLSSAPEPPTGLLVALALALFLWRSRRAYSMPA